MTLFDFAIYALGFIFVGGVLGFGAGVFWTLRTVYADRDWYQEERECR